MLLRACATTQHTAVLHTPANLALLMQGTAMSQHTSGVRGGVVCGRTCPVGQHRMQSGGVHVDLIAPDTLSPTDPLTRLEACAGRACSPTAATAAPKEHQLLTTTRPPLTLEMAA